MIKSRLAGKFILISIIALIISTVLFVFLSETFAMCMGSPGYLKHWEKVSRNSVNELQEYVIDNGITVTAATDNPEWIKEELDLNVSLSVNPDNTYLGNRDVWTVEGIPIECQDGTVYMYVNHSRSAARIAAFPAAAGSFLLITLPYTYKTVQRIMMLNRKVDNIIDGDFTIPVESFGNDELTMLENSVENLRLEVMSQLDKKSSDIDLDNRIITALLHDIRTPLTRLTGYLDIIRYKKFNDDAEFDRYLNCAVKNAEELKIMTEDFFAGVSSKGILTGMQVKYMIEESCSDLITSGFNVNSRFGNTAFRLSMNSINMQRIIDNLTHNIQKYADIMEPVTISLNNDGNELTIDYGNGISLNECAESHGIGIATVKMLAVESGGRVIVKKTEELFDISVIIPVMNS